MFPTGNSKGNLIIPILLLSVVVVIAFIDIPAVPPVRLFMATPSLTKNIHHIGLTVDGHQRISGVLIPSILGPEPPVVVFLHGGFATPEEFIRNGVDVEAQLRGYISVFPYSGTTDQTWNAGDCCRNAVREKVDDVKFIRLLLDRVSRDYKVDAKRIYIYGKSNGGMLAYRLACEIPERISAIASWAGPMTMTSCQPRKAVSIIYFHGMADGIVPYDGGQVSWEPNYKFSSAPEVLQHWRELNNCRRTVPAEQIEGITITAFAGCRDGAEVKLYTSPDGRHETPLGYTTKLNLNKVIFEFLASHSINP
jgi:polyhydroxybutyrate depolymerase